MAGGATVAIEQTRLATTFGCQVAVECWRIGTWGHPRRLAGAGLAAVGVGEEAMWTRGESTAATRRLGTHVHDIVLVVRRGRLEAIAGCTAFFVEHRTVSGM